MVRVNLANINPSVI